MPNLTGTPVPMSSTTGPVTNGANQVSVLATDRLLCDKLASLLCCQIQALLSDILLFVVIRIILE